MSALARISMAGVLAGIASMVVWDVAVFCVWSVTVVSNASVHQKFGSDSMVMSPFGQIVIYPIDMM